MLQEMLSQDTLDRLMGFKEELRKEEEQRFMTIIAHIGAEEKMVKRIIALKLSDKIEVKPYEIWPYMELKIDVQDIAQMGLTQEGLYQKIEFMFNFQLRISFQAINVFYDKVWREPDGKVLCSDTLMFNGDEEDANPENIELRILALR